MAVIILILLLFDLEALRWGVDTSDGIDSPEWGVAPELDAAMSLGRLWQSQGKQMEIVTALVG